MYPADKFGILYGFDDLPDVIQYEAGPFDLAYKVSGGNGAVYRTPWVYWPEYDSEWQAEIGGTPILSTGPDGGIEAWVPMGSGVALEWNNGERFRPDGYEGLRGGYTDNRCLFGGLTLDPWPLPFAGSNWNNIVQDNFEDTYTGTYQNNQTFTFVRQSRCVWQGQGIGLENTLAYTDLETYTGWTMNGTPKTNGAGEGQYQNDPTGIYDWSGQGEQIVVS